MQLIPLLNDYFHQVFDVAGEMLLLNCRVVCSGVWLVLVLRGWLIDADIWLGLRQDG